MMTLSNQTINSLSDFDQKSISFLSSLAISWLIIPYIIFIFGFYKWYLVVPTLLVLAYFSKPIIANLYHQNNKLPKYYLITAFLSAVFFVWLSGLIPPLGMAMDWEKHFVIINFMASSQSWPPVVLSEKGLYFLRYNLGLYLLPVLLNNVVNIGLRYWMAIYQIIGLCLFFVLLAFSTLSSTNSTKVHYTKVMLICLLFMGFSGLDIIGDIYKGNGPNFNAKIEWWAQLSSFSSSKTQLDFTPQHCLPAWIGVSLLYLNARCDGAILKEELFLLLAMIFFWSPLVFIGVILLFKLYLKESLSLLKKPHNLIMCLLMCLVILLPLVLYFTADTGGIPKWIMFDFSHPNFKAIKEIFLFLLLEVLIYLGIVFLFFDDSFHKALLVNTLLVFIVCTLFHMGVKNNDFSLKVSMPPLCLLAIFVSQIFVASDFQQLSKQALKVILLITYLIGTVTPISRVIESVNTINIDYNHGIDKVENWSYVQYFASAKDEPFFLKDHQ